MDNVFIYKLIIASVSVFVINIPFGYWGAHVKKFSLQWILAVHIPVPFIIIIRLFFHLGFAWHTYLFFIISYFMGHKLGGIIHNKQLKSHNTVSACLFIDLKRNYRKK